MLAMSGIHITDRNRVLQYATTDIAAFITTVAPGKPCQFGACCSMQRQRISSKYNMFIKNS
jgi:hypothetical protein